MSAQSRTIVAIVVLAIGMGSMTGRSQSQIDERRRVREESSPSSQSQSDYQGLVRLAQEMARGGSRLPDFSPAALAAQKQQIEAYRQRLAAIRADDWPTSRKVDYLLVVAQLNQQDFHHRVLQPWARDPGHYVDLLLRLVFQDLPIPPERLPMYQAQLRNVPTLLEQARTSLTRPSGEFARYAVFYLENTGGVNNREPRRPVLPQGAIGWFRDLVEQAGKHQPELVEDAKRALAAAESYRDWIKANMGNWNEPSRIGLDHYAWYLRHVKYLPISVEQIRSLGQAEWDRTRAFLAIVQNKNKVEGAPELQLADTPEELKRRVTNAEKNIRAFITKYKLLTIPADFPDHFESEARWIVRPDGSRHFWERHVYRDPTQIHIHASIPGHAFHGRSQLRLQNPIRRMPNMRDTVNAEGWAVYLEEMFLQHGLYDDLPGARENAYIAQLFRAVRVSAELNMQAGTWTSEDVIKFWLDEVPMMEMNIARQDASNGLRRPTELINTVTGKWQLEHLLAERMRQLGDKFDLGAFHDQILQSGLIPWALVRWELTGLDDEVKPMWDEARGTLMTSARP